MAGAQENNYSNLNDLNDYNFEEFVNAPRSTLNEDILSDQYFKV